MAQPAELETDVIIVGAGPVGLSLSIQLSAVTGPVGPIKHLVLEKYGQLSKFPKAIGLNQRTLETFRRVGIESKIYAVASDPKNVARVAWYTSIGRDSHRPGFPYKHLLGREIFGRYVQGHGQFKERWEQASPSRFVSCSQLLAGPILLQRAQERTHPETKVLFNSAVSKVNPSSDTSGPSVVLDDGTTIKAKYIVIADGGRNCAESLGVEISGQRNLVDMVSAHFKAPDLYAYLAKLGLENGHAATENVISFFANPELKGSRASGFLYHLGPYNKEMPETCHEFGKDWEWVFPMAFAVNDPARLDEGGVINRVRAALNLPDLKIDIQTIGHWYIQSLTAETFALPRKSSTPNIFIVGDAAHRVPPSGALGLNTGIGDAANLAWKIALALQSPEDFGTILGSFNTERRPLALTIAKRTFRNWESHGNRIDTAIGISPAKTAEECWEATKTTIEGDGEEGQKKRQALAVTSTFMDNIFAAQGMEVGYHYLQGAIAINEDEDEVVHAEAEAEKGALGLPLPTLVYTPVVKAGHFLPHAWVHTANGDRISTVDICQYPRFALLTAPSSLVSWRDAVEKSTEPLARCIDVFSISPRKHFVEVHADFIAADEQWTPHDVGIGAILVRPDGIVAWVTRGREIFKQQVLDAALQKILAQKRGH